MRYFVELQYKGSRYHGWQKQPNASTVQTCLEKALSIYLRDDVLTTGSGRTDTGVHAHLQVAHFDYPSVLDEKETSYRINALLPKDIVVNEIYAVSKDAHARFSPYSRAYQYFLSDKRSPFRQELCYFFPKKIDFDLMNEAGKLLCQYSDFESFSKVNTSVHTFECKVEEAYWRLENDTAIFYIKADRFLRGMVRAIVGTLLEIGLGKMTLDQFEGIIKQKSRKAAGRAVPAEGLFLWEVNYPQWVRA